MDYSKDTSRYGKLDKILNPKGDFSKPTLEQIRLHNAAYRKAKKVSPRDKKAPGPNIA
jgi:hypothetical protein